MPKQVRALWLEKVPPPTAPPTCSDMDFASLHALAKGEASSEQQIHALKYIVEIAAGAYEPAFHPTERETAFAEGKRHVGMQIVTIVNNTIDTVRRYHGRRPPRKS